MNPIEQIWKEIRTRGVKNEAFKTLEKVIDRLCDTIVSLSQNDVSSITGRQWILNLFWFCTFYLRIVLNTHNIGSLYHAFPADKARSLAKRLEIHYTPKHGSWLNIAEIELSAVTQQCLNRRIPDMEFLNEQLSLWEKDRNNSSKYVNWYFTTDKARGKLNHPYHKL